MALALSLLVAAVLIFSGLSWLRPSPQERRQMETRQAARKMGLHPHVRAVSEWAKPRSPKPMIPFYTLELPIEPAFSLWRSAHEWVAQPDHPQSNRLIDSLQGWLDACPSEVLGIDGSSKHLGVWWLAEQQDQLETLQQWLKQCPLALNQR